MIDNLVVLLVPGAMETGIDDPLLYASIAAGFAVAYPFAFLANRHLIARGKGHALVHEYHHAGWAAVVGVRVPAPHERAALLHDEQVALATALTHVADLRQFDHRDPRRLDRPLLYGE